MRTYGKGGVETYVDTVIQRAVLSDGDDGRLVVGGSVDGAQPVCGGGKTVRDVSGQDAALCSCIQALEIGVSLVLRGSESGQRSP